MVFFRSGSALPWLIEGHKAAYLSVGEQAGKQAGKLLEQRDVRMDMCV